MKLTSYNDFGCEFSGSASCVDNLSDRDFTIGGESAEIEELTLTPSDGALTITMADALTNTLKASLTGYDLHVDSVILPITSGTFPGVNTNIFFANTGLSWTVNQQVSLSLVERPPFSLSVHARPACGATVTDLSVRPEWRRTLSPAPATAMAGETQSRWVTSTSTGEWRDALPIGTNGSSVWVPRQNSFAQLRQAYPGFAGFGFRLKNNPSVTAQCTWTFVEPETPTTPTAPVEPEPAADASQVTLNVRVTPGDRKLTVSYTMDRALRGILGVKRYEVQYKAKICRKADGSYDEDGKPVYVPCYRTWISHGGNENDPAVRQTTRVLDGLTPGTPYDVRVRVIDWADKMSGWATGSGTPTGAVLFTIEDPNAQLSQESAGSGGAGAGVGGASEGESGGGGGAGGGGEQGSGGRGLFVVGEPVGAGATATADISGTAAPRTQIVGRRARAIASAYCFVPDSAELGALGESTHLRYRLDSAQDFDLCLWAPDPNWRSAPAYASCRGAGGVLPEYASLLQGAGREEFSVDRAQELMTCIVPGGTASEGGAWRFRIAPHNPEPEYAQ